VADVIIDWPAVDRFLHGPVMAEIAAEIGPRVKRDAKRLVPRRRGAALYRSLDWARGADGIGPFVKIGGKIYDMDIEAPADQFRRTHPKALKVSLAMAINELRPLWGSR
jgi:hypothetical protein